MRHWSCKIHVFIHLCSVYLIRREGSPCHQCLFLLHGHQRTNILIFTYIFLPVVFCSIFRFFLFIFCNVFFNLCTAPSGWCVCMRASVFKPEASLVLCFVFLEFGWLHPLRFYFFLDGKTVLAGFIFPLPLLSLFEFFYTQHVFMHNLLICFPCCSFLSALLL